MRYLVILCKEKAISQLTEFLSTRLYIEDKHMVIGTGKTEVLEMRYVFMELGDYILPDYFFGYLYTHDGIGDYFVFDTATTNKNVSLQRK